MGLDATAFDSSVMVTTELSEASKFASVTRVMEITFAPRATGILGPIMFVLKLAAVAIEQQKPNSNRRVMTIMVNRRLLTMGRLKWHGNRKSDNSSKINHIFPQNTDVSTSVFESSPQFL